MMDMSELREFRIIRIVEDSPEALVGLTLFGLAIERVRLTGAVAREGRARYCQHVYVEGTPRPHEG